MIQYNNCQGDGIGRCTSQTILLEAGLWSSHSNNDIPTPLRQSYGSPYCDCDVRRNKNKVEDDLDLASLAAEWLLMECCGSVGVEEPLTKSRLVFPSGVEHRPMISHLVM